MKLLLIFTLGLIFAGLIDASKPCGTWKPYKTEKCFKIFNKLANYTNAQATCFAQDDATLVSIGSAHEQNFLKQLFFTTNDLVDNVWLGGRYTEGQFQWEDGANWTYSNWASGSPQNEEGYCLQMNSEDTLLASWTDVSCLKRNLIVCQRAQPLAVLEGVLTELKKEFEQHLVEYREMETKIGQLEVNSLPIGFIYVQLPKESAPSAIWPSMTWTEVSSTYAGVFFRVDGGEAAQFGDVQEENAPRLTQVKFNFCQTSPTNGCGSINSANPHSIPSNGTWSDLVTTAVRYVYKIAGIDNSQLYTYSAFNRYRHSTGEVRPRNMAVRVWKRTG